MFAAAITTLVGRLLPEMGKPVPIALWRPSRPTLDQTLWAAIRHRTSARSRRQLMKWLFPGKSGRR
jgi:hypothetical protein